MIFKKGLLDQNIKNDMQRDKSQFKYSNIC
jgi:hypothetical protein